MVTMEFFRYKWTNNKYCNRLVKWCNKKLLLFYYCLLKSCRDFRWFSFFLQTYSIQKIICTQKHSKIILPIVGIKIQQNVQSNITIYHKNITPQYQQNCKLMNKHENRNFRMIFALLAMLKMFLFSFFRNTFSIVKRLSMMHLFIILFIS